MFGEQRYHIEIEWWTTPLFVVVATFTTIALHLVWVMKACEILLNRYLMRKLLYRIARIHNRLFSLTPLWRYADKNLEVDTRHRA